VGDKDAQEIHTNRKSILFVIENGDKSIIDTANLIEKENNKHFLLI
jgi:hypothetical protein